MSTHTVRAVRPAATGTAVVATSPRGAQALGGLLEADLVDATVVWRRADLPALSLEALLTLLPRLAWLHTDTAGVDDLPLAELEARGVVVTKTTAYTQAVAEWIVTAVLASAKGLPTYSRASDAQQWRPGIGAPRLVAGSRAVILGAGDIAKTAAAALAALGVEIHLIGRQAVGWRENLQGVDYFIVACPLTRQTTGCVDSRVLRQLDGAALVNVGRGGVVDEDALMDALTYGNLSAAVLDVFVEEPLPVEHPLWQLPGVLVLPHDTWRAKGAGRRQVDDFLAQLHRYETGGADALQRRVDLAAGY